jgi:DNA polymerase-3 subunit alpha
VRHLFTRESKPFVAATLEDLDGSIDVNVWPEVCQRTKDLWVEGNILLIEGKVQSRRDQIQVSVDSARIYKPEDVPPPPLPKRKLRVVLMQSGDQESDTSRLRNIFDIIKEYSGKDEVRLRITGDEGSQNLRLDNTGYCPELHQRLVEIVGEANLVVG